MNSAARQARRAPQARRARGRRPLWQRVLLVPAALLAVYLVVRAIVEVATIHYGMPASYAQDWGGPSLAGVLAVHAGPGLAIIAAAIWWGLRRGPAQR